MREASLSRFNDVVDWDEVEIQTGSDSHTSSHTDGLATSGGGSFYSSAPLGSDHANNLVIWRTQQYAVELVVISLDYDTISCGVRLKFADTVLPASVAVFQQDVGSCPSAGVCLSVGVVTTSACVFRITLPVARFLRPIKSPINNTDGSMAAGGRGTPPPSPLTTPPRVIDIITRTCPTGNLRKLHITSCSWVGPTVTLVGMSDGRVFGVKTSSASDRSETHPLDLNDCTHNLMSKLWGMVGAGADNPVVAVCGIRHRTQPHFRIESEERVQQRPPTASGPVSSGLPWQQAEGDLGVGALCLHADGGLRLWTVAEREVVWSSHLKELEGLGGLVSPPTLASLRVQQHPTQPNLFYLLIYTSTPSETVEGKHGGVGGDQVVSGGSAPPPPPPLNFCGCTR